MPTPLFCFYSFRLSLSRCASRGRLASKSFACSRQAARASSLRSLAKSVFFLHVQPRRQMARLIGASLTFVPYLASHRKQCCSSVASGYASSCSLSPACRAAPFFAGRPARGLAPPSPVSRRCARLTFDGGERDTKQCYDLRSWSSLIYCAKHTQSQIVRVCSHAFMMP